MKALGSGLGIDQYAIINGATLESGFVSLMSTSTAGKSTGSNAITGGQKTFVCIAAGQSPIANIIPTPYTASSSNVQHLSMFDNVVYQSKDPLIGAVGANGNYLGRLGDKLITDGTFARVIWVPCSVGGTSVFDWSPAGVLNHLIRIAYLRVRQNGWHLHADVRLGVIWDQGQQDAAIGTSSANYQARWRTIKETLDGFGYSGKWFIATETMNGNVTNATIQASQAALVDNVRVFAGPNIDSLTGATNRQEDGTHMTDAGAVNAANLWAPILAAAYP